MTRKNFFYVFFGPILFGFVVSVLFSITLQKYIPNDLNITKWSEFSHKVEDEFQIQNKYCAVLVLMTVHGLQMYCCLPMLHITKIFYGYWLGLVAGYFLCVAWEFTLYIFYLQYVPKNIQSSVQEHVSAKRKRGYLIIEIATICLSTLPLQTKMLIYSLSDVCKNEFMIGCMIPTSVMTLKNVIVGKMLRSHPSTYTLAIMASVISFSLVLPTLSTMFFSSSVFLMLKNVDIYNDDSEQVSEPFIKETTTPATSISVILEGSESEYDDEAELDEDNRDEETSKNIITVIVSNEKIDDDDPDQEISKPIISNNTIQDDAGLSRNNRDEVTFNAIITNHTIDNV